MEQQRGGRLLGKGLYGCAFDPPLICKNKTNTKGKIGKITSVDDAEHEYSVSQILKDIPHSEEYFVIVDDICITKPRANQKEKEITNCSPLDDTNVSDVRQLIMPFGGIPFGQLSKKLNKNEFFIIAQKLLEAGTLLLTGRIVHSDLHAMNVLLDDNSVKLIDFGFAWMPEALSLSNIHQLEKLFAPHITQQTPECTVMSGLQEGYKYSHVIASIADSKAVLTLIYKLTGRTVQSQIEELEQFMRSSISFREHNWFSFYKIYWSKIDSWAFGCLMLTSFTNILYNEGQIDETQFKNVVGCILGLCAMDPGKRLDAAEALEIFAPNSEILALPEVQAWLKNQREIRKSLENKIGVQ